MTQKRITHARTKRRGRHASGGGARYGLGSKVAIISVLTTTALAGCSPRFLNNPFSDNRPKQVIEGERHTPIYNVVDQQRIARAQGAPPAEAIMPVAPIPAAMSTPMVQTKSDNFDYYAAATPPQGAGAPANQALGNLNPAPMKVEGAPMRVRKPLQENHYASAAHAKQASAPAPASYHTTPAVASVQPAVIAEAKEEAVQPAQQPSFFDRVFGGASSKETSNPASSPPWKNRSEGGVTLSEQNDPSPPLSSVPQSPQEFKDIKSSRDQEIQALQEEHARAQQQKNSLSGEPSQQQADMKPVEMPAPPVQPQPQPVQPEAVAPPPAAPASTASDAPRAPRRGIDIMTQEEWDAYQRSRAAVRQSVVPPVESPAITPAPESLPQATPVPEEPPALPEAEEPPANPNGYNNLIMTPPPKQRNTPVPTSSLPKDPAKALAAKSETRSEEALTSAMAATLAPASGSQIAPASQAMEVAEKRPSFFERFLGVSPHPSEAEKPEAEAAFLPVAAAAAPQDTKPAPESKDKLQAEAKPAETASSTASDWLHAFVSDAKASTPAIEAADATTAQKIEAAAPEGDSTQMLAHVSDKATMRLVTPVESFKAPETPVAKQEKTEVARSESSVPSSSPALKQPAFFGRQINQPENTDTHSKAAPVDSVQASQQPESVAKEPAAAEPQAQKPETASAEKPPEEQGVRRSYFSRLFGSEKNSIDIEEDAALTAEKAAAIAPSAQGETKQAETKPEPAQEAAAPVAPSAADILKLNEGETLASKHPKRIVKAGKPLPESKDPQVIKRLSGYHGLPTTDPVASNQPEAAKVETLEPAKTEQSAPAVAETSKGVDTSTEPLRRASVFSRLLGRFDEHDEEVEDSTKAVEAPVAAAEEKPAQPAPVEPVTAAAPVPAVAPGVQPAAQAGPPAPHVPFSERPSLISRIFSGGKPDDKAEAKKDDATPAAEAPKEAPKEETKQPEAVLVQPSAPAETAAPAPQPPVPLVQPAVEQAMPAPVQPVVTPGGNVSKAQAEASEAAAAAAAANPSSALPSPRLLDQVKTLPVSRYTARARAHKPKPD